MERECVLVVDEARETVSLLESLISSGLGVEVKGLTSAEEAVEAVSCHDVAVVVADVMVSDKDGLSLLKDLKAVDRNVIVILLSGYGSVDMAVEALKLGAYDFLTKPVNHARLLHTLRNALGLYRSQARQSALEEKGRAPGTPFTKELIGESPVMRRLLACIGTVAATDETVLITGDTGTGKELAARTIHRMSRRAGGPFVAVNCPAIPESILESELFGYKKGAFTSAVSDKKGLFEAARGGTIFLDEVADIPLSVQTKLLRVLQEKEFKPLGDTASVKVDVRVLASTNQDIDVKIEKGLFRDDLYYRLNVVTVRMPTLQERTEDIPLLASHFLRRYAHEFGRDIRGLSDSAVARLCERRWRGNVRELQNVIKRAVIFSSGPEIRGEDIDNPAGMPRGGEFGDDSLLSLDYRTARTRVLENFTVSFVGNLLRRTGGNVTRAARLAGMERQSLQQLLRRYNIDPHAYRKVLPKEAGRSP